MKKFLRIAMRTIFVFIGLIALYAIAALGLQRITINKSADYKTRKDISIYIKTNGVHTDIVVPVRTPAMDWTKYIKYADTDLKDSTYPYVGIGWGDKGFYLQTPEWKDLKFSVAFKAAFHLSTSAMHATFYKSIDTSESCKEIKINIANYEKMMAYIQNSFLLDTNGNSIHIPSVNDGYGDMDAFYEAKGSYSLFKTCNTWANNALKAGNQRAALWTVLDKGIFRHYK